MYYGAGEDSTELLRQASAGEDRAWRTLVRRHRARLKRLVLLRMDQRMASRVDASDVVQEAFADAARRMPDFAARPTVSFYVWLRQIAQDRLADLRDRHVVARKRSVLRERRHAAPHSSVHGLLDRFVQSATSPSGNVVRQETLRRVRQALDQLNARDREIIVMRHLEQMSVAEIAESLGISLGAVKMRRLRAVQHLRQVLETGLGPGA